MIRYDQAQNKPQNRASVQIWTDFEICKSEGAMKYDLTKPLTRGAKRTLDAFRREMFSLLSGKTFEEITVCVKTRSIRGRPFIIISMTNTTC